MKRSRRLLAPVLLLLLPFAPGCSRGANGTAASAKPSVAVEASPVVSGELKEAIEVVGTLAPKFQAEVKTEYSGTVAEVFVTEWVRVTKGTPLCPARRARGRGGRRRRRGRASSRPRSAASRARARAGAEREAEGGGPRHAAEPRRREDRGRGGRGASSRPRGRRSRSPRRGSPRR